MATNKHTAFAEGLFVNLLSNAIALVIGGIVAYLKHNGSEWVSPLLFGGLAWLLVMGIFIVFKLWRSIPARHVKVTNRNVQLLVRGWLDDIGLKVQTAKDSSAEFKYVVTTDGNWVISLLRLRENPEYLTFTGFFKDEAQNFSHFTPDEKIQVRLAIRLELARAVIGYTSQDFLEGFTLFKRIPISSQLSIEDVSRTLWEVEAALSSVFIVGAKFLARKKAGALSLLGGIDET